MEGTLFMTDKRRKTVLIVDDEPRMCEIVKDAFEDCTYRGDCPYQFEVELASSYKDAIANVRGRTSVIDVVVLDMRMEEEKSGLRASLGLMIAEQFGPGRPIRILFTGFPSYPQCVEVMRTGAWDYIVKEDVGDKPMARIVVESAVARLRQLDLRREQEERIATDWFPRNFWALQRDYAGKLIAVWHQPEVEVIATGNDAFELEGNLQEWRSQRPEWQQPFIVAIPRGGDDRG
jgi:ActR/RegA family two-component response regulator